MPIKGVRGGQFRLLSDDDIKRVHFATLDVLDDVGIRLSHPEALELWADHGARVDFDHEIVRIPEHVLTQALADAPKRVTLYGKSREWDVPLDTLGTVYTMGGAGAPWVLDLDDGHRRPATMIDLEDLTRLQDALPNWHVAHWLVLPQDIPQEGAEYITFAAMLKHTGRPHHTLPGSRQCIRDQIEMAAVVAGSTEAVRRRPFYAQNICVLSPLYQPWDTTDQLIECARQRLPMLLEADTIAGGTAPFTLAGALVEMNANVLSYIALAQLVNPGTPCIYSSSSGVMDMQTGNYSAAAPESTLLHMASTQVAHFYGLPFQGGNTPDAKLPDAQMGYERASHFLALAYAGCDIIHVATGNLEQMYLASYEQCVMDNEILAACFRILEGFKVNEDTLAVDVFRDVGHDAAFVSHEHTLRYLRRERWYPRITDRGNWKTWEGRGAKDMREAAKEEVRRILDEHHPEYVTEEQAREIDRLAVAGQRRVLAGGREH
jgi:trimethylamine--corrinoid protein Co-methyltransferase